MLGTPGVVVDEERLEVPPQSLGVASPQEGAPGEAPGFGKGELLVADLFQPLSL